MSATIGELALALTSSTGVMSAAVGRVGSAEPLSAATLATDRRHAEEISPLLQKLTADAGISLSDLDLLVVDRGPGRFTGLRVGLATIKTLAFALDVSVVGVTSLEILAARAHRRSDTMPVEHATVTAVIDARRAEVFQQRFGPGLQPLGAPEVGPATELAARATGTVVGDGLDRYRVDYETAATGETVELRYGVEVDAAIMLTLAAGRRSVSGSQIEPLYLRDPDVNPNVKTRPRL